MGKRRKQQQDIIDRLDTMVYALAHLRDQIASLRRDALAPTYEYIQQPDGLYLKRIINPTQWRFTVTAPEHDARPGTGTPAYD